MSAVCHCSHYLPPVSLISVVHLHLRISPRIFEKIRYFRGLGKIIHEKNLKQKSRDTVPLTHSSKKYTPRGNEEECKFESTSKHVFHRIVVMNVNIKQQGNMLVFFFYCETKRGVFCSQENQVWWWTNQWTNAHEFPSPGFQNQPRNEFPCPPPPPPPPFLLVAWLRNQAGQ